MKKWLLSIFITAFLLVLLPGMALAQAYTFNIPTETANVYLNDDGSAILDYVIGFNNDPSAHAIDYVDLGLPNASFVDSSITADINGVKVTDISRSGFQGTGPGVVAGVAVGLGSQTIAPGKSGTLHVRVGEIHNMLSADPEKGKASAVFSPAWFTGAHGVTNLTVVFHFSKSVKQDDATYHADQPGWSGQPFGYVDENGMVSYVWNNSNVSMNNKIDFGASFPSSLTFTSSAPVASASSSTGNQPGLWIIILVMVGAIGVVIYAATTANRRSNALQYEPPKVSIEGLGVKRGLTAVEAAVLLKEPADKILTMILFSVVKKGAARVINNAPLQIEVLNLLQLQPYEDAFLKVFQQNASSPEAIRTGLAEVLGTLFHDVDESMRYFNRQQTIDYYRNIVRDAWTEVEAADTPEVTSQKLEEKLDWTLLDQEYAPRTQRLFEAKQVFLPAWWQNLDPAIYHNIASFPQTPQASTPASIGLPGTPASISKPVVPGADFAASIVRGTQNFSAQVIGDLTAFTHLADQKNVPPPSTQSLWSGNVSGSGENQQQSLWSDTFGSSESGGGSRPVYHTSFHPHPSGGGHHCACACAGGGR